MGLKILITGGLGFLGHHLCKRLLAAQPDCQLTLVDDLSSSRIDYSWLIGKAEIRIEDFLASDFRNHRFDRIYHLASPVGSLGILGRSGYVAKSIMDLALCAGELAAAYGTSLLYVSSSETYGKSGWQDENDELVIPVRTGTRMEYSLGKLSGEHLLKNLSQRLKFRLTIVRPFNILGEFQSSRIGFVVPTFFEQAMQGRPLSLFYGGEQFRCFCHAEDMAEGLILVQEKGGFGETYNLGNPANKTTIRGLAEKIRDLCGSISPLESVDPDERFGSQFIEAPPKQPVISKAMKHLGWMPRIDLDSALERIRRHHGKIEEDVVHAFDKPRVH
jgi:nucleoside-diphosphate-sugar epimerase